MLVLLAYEPLHLHQKIFVMPWPSTLLIADVSTSLPSSSRTFSEPLNSSWMLFRFCINLYLNEFSNEAYLQARYLKLEINMYAIQIAQLALISILIVVRLTGLLEVMRSHYHASINGRLIS